MYRYLRVRIRGLVVSVLAFQSDYSSSNPAKVKNVVRLERNKQKRGRGWPIKNSKQFNQIFGLKFYPPKIPIFSSVIRARARARLGRSIILVIGTRTSTQIDRQVGRLGQVKTTTPWAIFNKLINWKFTSDRSFVQLNNNIPNGMNLTVTVQSH